MVSKEDVKKVLFSTTGEVLLDGLFDVDYVFGNLARRSVNSTNFSMLLTNFNPEAYYMDEREEVVKHNPLLQDSEVFVQLMSPHVFSGDRFTNDVFSFSDSSYQVAENLINNLIDRNADIIRRDIAYRSSGVLAKIYDDVLDIHSVDDSIAYYKVSCIDYLIDGEYVRVASSDSSTPYTMGIVHIEDAEKNIISVDSHRRLSVGDTILSAPKAGLGVTGMYELFYGQRVFNQTRTKLTSPTEITAKSYLFDELCQSAFERVLKSGLVAYLPQKIFNRLSFNNPSELRKIDNGYGGVYYEYRGNIIAINNFLAVPVGLRDYMLFLDLSTLQLNFCTPLVLASLEDITIGVQQNFRLNANFDFQLSCSNFAKNVLVRL